MANEAAYSCPICDWRHTITPEYPMYSQELEALLEQHYSSHHISLWVNLVAAMSERIAELESGKRSS